MAIEVTGDFATPFGTTVATTYWRWAGLGIDVTTGAANVVLYAYVDSQAFGKQPIGQRSYQVTGEDFLSMAASLDGPTPTGLSAVIYSYVRANDEFFAGAADV